jgi:hypothetical protein
LEARAAPAASVLRVDGVELDAIHECVVIDRSGVRSALTQRFAVGFPSESHVRSGDRGERDELDGVDLNLAGTNPIVTTRLDARPLPQPDRERDLSRQNVISQLAAEVHRRDATGVASAGNDAMTTTDRRQKEDVLGSTGSARFASSLSGPRRRPEGRRARAFGRRGDPA